jgi:predicted amidohydrolase YtcJ
VARHVPKPTAEERARALRAAIDEAHKNGVTSIQDANGSTEDLELYSEAHRAGDLSIRVYSALGVTGLLNEQAIAELDASAEQYPDDPLFKAGAIAVALDGSIEARTAAMLEPYANDSSEGAPLLERDDYNRMVRLLDARGWQVWTRAAGDRAVRMALEGYEHAVRSNRVPARGRRHRIEHLETVDAADVPRFAALGVLASMQPFAGSPDRDRIEGWLRNVGPERGSRGWPYGSIAAASGRIAFGSGWPSSSFNPMLGLHTAVTRTTPANLPEGGWYPAERLALKAAIDAYTSGAAWASFDEQRKGSLAAGMLADLVVLSDDIFDAPRSRLASTRVAVTIFDGKVVYQRDGKQTN